MNISAFMPGPRVHNKANRSKMHKLVFQTLDTGGLSVIVCI